MDVLGMRLFLRLLRLLLLLLPRRYSLLPPEPWRLLSDDRVDGIVFQMVFRY